LLWLLREQHREGVTAAATRAYHEGFELPDPQSGTIAENIVDLTARTAGMPWPDAVIGRSGSAPTSSGTPLVVAMQVVSEILGKLLPLWDFEAMEAATTAARRTS
jgi:hypothetical protein